MTFPRSSGAPRAGYSTRQLSLNIEYAFHLANREEPTDSIANVKDLNRRGIGYVTTTRQPSEYAENARIDISGSREVNERWSRLIEHPSK
jgi:hypothetical protein